MIYSEKYIENMLIKALSPDFDLQDPSIESVISYEEQLEGSSFTTPLKGFRITMHNGQQFDVTIARVR